MTLVTTKVHRIVPKSPTQKVTLSILPYCVIFQNLTGWIQALTPGLLRKVAWASVSRRTIVWVLLFQKFHMYWKEFMSLCLPWGKRGIGPMDPTLNYVSHQSDWCQRMEEGRIIRCGDGEKRKCISVPVIKVPLIFIFSNETPARGSNNLLMFLVHPMPYIGQQYHHAHSIYLNLGNPLAQQSQPGCLPAVDHKVYSFGSLRFETHNRNSFLRSTT